MDRITLKHLEALCARINRLQGMPLEAYSKDGGGVSCPLSHGHVSKRELYELMHAYIRGIEDGRMES